VSKHLAESTEQRESRDGQIPWAVFITIWLGDCEERPPSPWSKNLGKRKQNNNRVDNRKCAVLVTLPKLSSENRSNDDESPTRNLFLFWWRIKVWVIVFFAHTLAILTFIETATNSAMMSIPEFPKILRSLFSTSFQGALLLWLPKIWRKVRVPPFTQFDEQFEILLLGQDLLNPTEPDEPFDYSVKRKRCPNILKVDCFDFMCG
jgi:hypothetical protein